MALSVVQSWASGTSPITVSGITAGNSLVVAGVYGTSGGAMTAVSDNAGNSYSQLGTTYTGSFNRFTVFYATAASAPTSITITGGLNRECVVWEITSALTGDTNPSGQHNANSTSQPSPSITPGADGMALALLSTNTSRTISGVSSGWGNDQSGALSGGAFAAASHPSSAGVATSNTWTLSSASQGDTVVLAFKSSIVTNTHSTPATAALTRSNTHSAPASAALKATYSHTAPASAALKRSNTHTVSATASLGHVHFVAADAALTTTTTHSAPATAALTNRHWLGASAALRASPSHSLPATAAILSTEPTLIMALAALKATSAHSVGSSAALTNRHAVAASADLRGSVSHSLPASASLSGRLAAPSILRHDSTARLDEPSHTAGSLTPTRRTSPIR